MASTPYIVAPLTNSHTHTIILLHGRDSIASEFASEFFESQASDERTLPEIFPTVKWVFPTSKPRKSARFGGEMPQWFDIWSVEDPKEKEEIQLDGLRESIEDILGIIRDEITSVPASRIILGGISQGSATAIMAMLYGQVRLGGFIGLCSWLPLQGWVADYARHFGRTLHTPTFLSHSKDDNVVPIDNGRLLHRTLEYLDVVTIWKEYEDGGHWINEPQGVDDMVAFLQEKVEVSA
ncbi:alpha/beta-hydrolase [Acephala macrosclerotiorum]|nr:alpha/beta-hydrolase [Acephala macrosclerotiorum]